MKRGGPGIANKKSFVLGLLKEFRVPLTLIGGSAAAGAYFLGPYGLLCGVGMGLLIKIKSKFMIGESIKVGIMAPDSDVITQDGQKEKLL